MRLVVVEPKGEVCSSPSPHRGEGTVGCGLWLWSPKVEFALLPLPFRERAGVRVQTISAPQEFSLTPPPHSPSPHYSRTATPAILVTLAMPFSLHHIPPSHHAVHRLTPPPGEQCSRQNPEYKNPPGAGGETCNEQNGGREVDTITDAPVELVGVVTGERNHV